ncbi:MAG: acyltransferase family protein [Sphingobacteriales bacterium]|nr:acyltransferase family protein [Sphingobacteriales bacterium]
MAEENKLLWANDLRATATIAVILLHAAASENRLFDATASIDTGIVLLYNAMCRWSVPVFVMLTGSFALDNYNGNLKLFFSKVFKRIFLPFLFWSTVYFLVNDGAFVMDVNNSLQDKMTLLWQRLLSGTAVHLWFVYMIFGMYLLIPFVSKWVKYCTNKEKVFFILLWSVFLFVAPLIEKGGYDISFDYSYFSGYIGYLVIGNFLLKENKRMNNRVYWFLLIGTILFSFAITYFLSYKDHKINETFFENLSPNVALMSVSIYLLFKNVRIAMPSIGRKCLDIICTNSYGIFLIHILILTIVRHLPVNFLLLPVLIRIPLTTLLCLFVSVTIIILLRKIPYLKFLVG